MLLNEMMKIERAQYLRADSRERTEERRGHANGFKSKVLTTRVGKLTLAIPQVRGLVEGFEPFYPKALERVVRSERALAAAVAESCLQGVSTRRMLKITEELCGFLMSSSQVSRITSEFDEQLSAWRNRPLGACPYLLLDARYKNVRHGRKVVSCAVLWAIGVDLLGKRSVLGVSV